MTLICIVIGLCIIGAGMFVSSALMSISDSIKTLAHEVHIHAETMNEIKHQGIGCDKNEI